jgi:hypothetical protein
MQRRLAVSAAVVVLVVALTGAGLAARVSDSASTSRGSTAELLAYERALLPVAKDWGSIEVLGMRPAVADLRTGGPLGRPDLVATQARAWLAALQADRDKLRALAAPASVRAAGPLLDRSIALYVDAASSFLAAATGPVTERVARIERGIDQARRGALLYNDASAVLQAARRAHGLPPTPDFPDLGAGR